MSPIRFTKGISSGTVSIRDQSLLYERHERLFVAVILAAFIALAIGFSLGPIYEGPDEILHYRYARLIATTHALPNVPALPPGQYVQTPLYYILIAPLTGVAGYPDLSLPGNRYLYYHAVDGYAPGNDNLNFYLHTRAEAFPYSDSPIARTIHVARLSSIVMGVCTLLVCSRIFRLLWPDRPDRRLAALGFVAFWPQFIYVSSVISNDNLLILLVTVSLWLLLRQLRNRPSWRDATLLGLVLGAAILAKVSALVLALPTAVVVLLDLRRNWRYAALTLILVLLVAGWWFVRNAILYGDPLLSRVNWEQLYPSEGIPDNLRLTAMLLHVPLAYNNLWARFGWLSVSVGEPIYRFFDLFVIISLAGLVVQLIRLSCHSGLSVTRALRIRQATTITLFAVVWIGFLSVYCATAWTCQQGRYLLPPIAAWGALFAFGLDVWTPLRLRMRVALSGVALMSTVAAICLFGYFLSAYRPLPLPAQIEHPLTLRFEDAAELIGVKSEVVHARPGQTIRISLYWRAIQPTATSLTAYLHSVGSNVVFRDSLPATGNLLSTDWLPGQTWAEEYMVVIPQDAEQQAAYPLVAGLYETQTQRGLTATDTAGNEVTPIVGRIAINGPAQPFDPDYRFGNIIGLAEPQITRREGQLDVCLRWLSLAPTSTDYHVFVHVLTDDGQLVTQSDSSPKGGRYPTDVWVTGETVDDCISLNIGNLPATGWHVALGLYQLPGGERLPVQNRRGQTIPDDAVSLAPGGQN